METHVSLAPCYGVVALMCDSRSRLQVRVFDLSSVLDRDWIWRCWLCIESLCSTMSQSGVGRRYLDDMGLFVLVRTCVESEAQVEEVGCEWVLRL